MKPDERYPLASDSSYGSQFMKAISFVVLGACLTVIGLRQCLLIGIGISMTAGTGAGNDIYIAFAIFAGIVVYWIGGTWLLIRKKKE